MLLILLYTLIFNNAHVKYALNYKQDYSPLWKYISNFVKC